MRKPPRIVVLLAILAAVGVWVAQDHGNGDPASHAARGPADRADPAPAATAGSTDLRPELPTRAPLQHSARNPFSTHSWAPPPRPAARAPVAAPTAPPLPYRYVGELVLPSGTQVFLARGDETFRVGEGETLDGEYRVESMQPGEIVFVHVPSGQRQTMRLNLPGDEGDAARAIVRSAGEGGVARAAPERPAAGAQTLQTTQAAQPAQTPAAQAAKPAQIRWEGPASAKAGASFNVALRMTSGEQIRSAPMEVRFDPKLLEPVSVRPGRYFGGNAAANFGYRINADGSIYIGVSNQAPTPATDAELLVLTFKPIKAGTSAELSVAALNLQGPAGRPVAYNALTAFKTTITP